MLLDIEKAINAVGSRFRLVNIASQKARQMDEGSLDEEFTKFTTSALNDIIENNITFTVIEKDESKEGKP